MIHAAAKLFYFLGKGEPPKVFQVFTFQRNKRVFWDFLWNLGELK
jgi:hypothetical protein